jgi:hypothetical protein
VTTSAISTSSPALEVELSLSFVDRVEDRIGLLFYRTMFRAPRTLLAVKHSFYFNETYGEAPQDRALLDVLGDDALRAEVLRHLEDEVRHAGLWRDHLTAHNEMPAEGALPFGDFVGMLRGAGWLPSTERLREAQHKREPLTDDELMAFFAVIHVIETQAVRQMILFRRTLRERGDTELDAVISSILTDEGRHMSYSKRALEAIGARGGDAGKRRARQLEARAFQAFLRLRAGDMRKILAYTFREDGAALPLRSRALLRALALAIHTMPTRVPGPDGQLTLDAAAPLPAHLSSTGMHA